MSFLVLLRRGLLAGLPLLFLAAGAVAQAPEYRFYYGNLHAHTGYSDGHQDSLQSGDSTPFDAYIFARSSQHFDFLGISEHNHPAAGMQYRHWALGRQQADSASREGQFVALYGMEWGTISSGGHALIYGYDRLIGWDSGQFDDFVAKGNYTGLWRMVQRQASAVVTLAHPNTSDYQDLLGAAFSPGADSVIVGSAFRSGPATSHNVTYSNPSNSSFESYWRRALAKGYHLAPSYDHDNHNTTFGRTTQGRLVILADTLTRSALLTALKARRFFASDDWNARLTLTLNDQWTMGAVVYSPNPSPTLTLTVADDDAEAAKIQLFRGIPGSGVLSAAVATAAPGTLALSWTDTTLAPGASAYYYAAIVQPDGDRLLSAPIWLTRALPTAIPEPVAAAVITEIQLWPNPVSHELDAAVTVTGADRAELFDALGRHVLTSAPTPLGTTSVLLPTANLLPGLYFVRALSASGTVLTMRTLVVK